MANLDELTQVRAKMTEMEATIASLARQQDTGRRTVVQRTTNNSSTTVNTTSPGPGFTRFAPDDEQELASGAASESGTLNLGSLIPSSAVYALVRFSADCGEDTASCDIDVRPGTSGTWTRPVHMIPMQDSGDTASNDNTEWVVLDGASFDYQVTVTVSASWSIRLLGYA